MKDYLEKILGIFTEALSAWKSYIDTRQEAYERKMDRKKSKAINYAEDVFLNIDMDWIKDILRDIDINKEYYQKFNKMRIKFNHNKDRFFKNNN